MNRRRFLAAAAAPFAAACTTTPPRPAATGSARIDRIELFPVRYPMTGYFKFFAGAHGAGRPAILVKITDGDGIVGWGQ